MPIAIRRIGDGYEAELTPPHGGSVPWRTERPLSARALIDALRERGCHPTDIGDALYEADPDWVPAP